jgi:hypothetical protein
MRLNHDSRRQANRHPLARRSPTSTMPPPDECKTGSPWRGYQVPPETLLGVWAAGETPARPYGSIRMERSVTALPFASVKRRQPCQSSPPSLKILNTTTFTPLLSVMFLATSES